MLVLLPAFLLILTSVGILIARWLHLPHAYGYTWLGASVMTLITWGLLLYQRWNPPAGFSIYGWRPVEGLVAQLTFQLDTVSWSYSFALVSLVLAVILTASARLDVSIPEAWASSLAITGAGLLAVLATTPLTLVLTWTVIDIAETALLLRSSDQTGQARQVIIAFSARVLGTASVIWAMLVSFRQGQVLSLTQVVPQAGIFLLIGAGLRLGVVPLYFPYSREVRMRRGVGTILRLVSPAVALPLLSRLPAAVASPDLAPFLLMFTALGSLYGSAMWLFSSDELNGRPYWLIALAGMAVGGAIRGHPEATVAWGVALVAAGGTLMLYSNRKWQIRFIPLLAFIGLTGLPYTPAASGWNALVVPPVNALDLVYIAAHSLLLIGFLRHTLRPGPNLSGAERWAQVMYPFGLFIPAISFWLTEILGRQGSLTMGVWWASILSTLLAVAGYAAMIRFERQPEPTAASVPHSRIDPIIHRVRWWILLAQRIGRGLSIILRLDWFYDLFFKIYTLLQHIIMFITAILEGAGGMLWVILLVVLIITVLRPGAKP